MDIATVLANERSNAGFIDLYREGLFLVAYERSCYAFHCLLRADYHVRRRHVKRVRADVVSLGFPERCAANVLQGREAETTAWGLRVPLSENEMPEGFEAWKAALPLQVAQAKVAAAASSPLAAEPTVPYGHESIEQLIRDFPLERKTPMDCMLFVADLKARCQ